MKTTSQLDTCAEVRGHITTHVQLLYPNTFRCHVTLDINRNIMCKSTTPVSTTVSINNEPK